MIHRIHARHHRQQHLRRADVARGFFAADVLLARLQTEAIRGPSGCILRHTDKTSGQTTLQIVLHRHEGRVRTAKTERHAKTLAVSDANVRAKLARRPQHRQREQIRAHHEQRARIVSLLRERFVVMQHAERVRIARQHRGEAFAAVVLPSRDVLHLHTHAERLHARLHHLDDMRMAFVGHQHPRGAIHLRQSEGQRLRAGRAFIQQRCIRDIQAGQIANHRLEIHQRLQASLRDLRLIRRVGRVPARILQHVPLDHRRRERVVVAEADEGAHHLVPAHHLLHAAQRLLLRKRRRQIQRLPAANPLRHHLVDELIERAETERLEHRRRFRGRRTDVTAGKIRGHDGARLLKRAKAANQ